MRKKLWIGLGVTAALAALCVGAVFALRLYDHPHPLEPLTSGQEETRPDGQPEPSVSETAEDTALRPFTVSAASYPAWAKYPADGDFSSENEIEAWYADLQKRRTYYGAGAGLLALSEKALPVFLNGTDGENRLFSPMSLYFALGMLAEITDGSSRQQVLSLLDAADVGALRRQSHELFLADYCDDGASANVPAASVWLRDDIAYRPDTLDTLSSQYFASSFRGTMGDPAYDGALQTWINDRTGGLLRDLTGGLKMEKETVISLVSTLYFRDKWDYEFSASRNTDAPFHGTAGDVTATFMRRTGDYGPYYYGDRFGAAEISLQKEGRMLFLLPDEGVSPESLLTDPEALDFLLTQDRAEWTRQKRIRVHMSVPKFDVQAQTELSDGLQALGVTDCFVPGTADFSPLTEHFAGEIYLSSARHGVRVTVDEQGVTAAAYTVMMAAGAAMPPEEEIDFVLDRPFIFLVCNAEGLPLFAGIVNQL